MEICYFYFKETPKGQWNFCLPKSQSWSGTWVPLVTIVFSVRAYSTVHWFCRFHYPTLLDFEAWTFTLAPGFWSSSHGCSINSLAAVRTFRNIPCQNSKSALFKHIEHPAWLTFLFSVLISSLGFPHLKAVFCNLFAISGDRLRGRTCKHFELKVLLCSTHPVWRKCPNASTLWLDLAWNKLKTLKEINIKAFLVQIRSASKSAPCVRPFEWTIVVFARVTNHYCAKWPSQTELVMNMSFSEWLKLIFNMTFIEVWIDLLISWFKQRLGTPWSSHGRPMPVTTTGASFRLVGTRGESDWSGDLALLDMIQQL